MKATVKILFMSLTQTLATTNMTTLTIRKLLLPLSATSSRAPIDTMTDPASGSHDVFGEKTTQIPMLHEHECSYPKSAGLNTTSTPSLNLHDESLLHSFLLSLTLLGFPYSLSLKQILVPRYNNFVLEEAADCTYACKLLQHLFRPYPKPTPHLHPYPCLHFRNSYYMIKSTFNTSTNPTLCR